MVLKGHSASLTLQYMRLEYGLRDEGGSMVFIQVSRHFGDY